MSSNLRLQRTCQMCGKEFVAKTTVTRNCSDTCAKRAYKAKKPENVVGNSFSRFSNIREQPIINLKNKEFLTMKDVAILINCSKQTVYSLIENGTIKATNYSIRKTTIKREDLNKIFS